MSKADDATIINRSGDPVPAILAPNVPGENLEAFVGNALQQPDIRNIAVILDAPVRNYCYAQARGQSANRGADDHGDPRHCWLITWNPGWA